MNPTSAPTSTSSVQRPDAAATARPGDCAFQRRAEDFSRLLREKSTNADQTDREPAGSDAVPIPMLQPFDEQGLRATPTPAPAATPQHGAFPAALAACAVVPAPAGTPAPVSMPCTQAVEAAAAIQARMDLSAPVDPAAARRFDVSIREPAGVQLSMRIVQPGAAEAAGRWALSIASADLNPSHLRRNTGRLEERLRARSLSSEPVRIEHDNKT